LAKNKFCTIKLNFLKRRKSWSISDIDCEIKYSCKKRYAKIKALN